MEMPTIYSGYDKTEFNILKRINKLLKEDVSHNTQEFLFAIRHYADIRGHLTRGQYNSLTKIESRFSPQEKIKLEAWKKEYFEKHIQDAKALAKYYKQAGYWVHLSRDILSSDDYVPCRHQYKKMSTNKYAIQVLKNLNDTPRFKKGAMVQLRSTVGGGPGYYKDLYPFRNRLAFVMDYLEECLTHAKGGKGYKILPMGHGNTIVAEERHLMKPNKRGVSS